MRDRLVDVLRAEPALSFAFLFGSRATGRARTDSDWDVAVYLDPALERAARNVIELRIRGDLGELGPVDLVVLNDAPPLLSHRALQGDRLFVRDPSTYVRFFVRTLARSGDEAHWRALHAHAREKRLEEGRFGRP